MGLADLPSSDPRPLKQKWEIRPEKLERQDRKAVWQQRDEQESEQVKARSTGRCEVWVDVNRKVSWRCKRRALHVHHMLGGNGVRGRGESAKAIRKQHACADCHSDIGNRVLVRIGDGEPHFTDHYRRVK